MKNKAPELDLIDIFGCLSKIPLQHRDRYEALKKIIELGKIALGSQVCTLTYIDSNTQALTQLACVGFEEGSEESKIHKIISSLENKGTINFNRVAAGVIVEEYDLQKDGKGIIRTEIARKYDLNSALCCPLTLEDQLIGYLNHFSSSKDAFSGDRKQLLEIFARQAVITIEKFEHRQTSNRSLSILNSLSESFLTASLETLLRQITDKACELLSVPICIVWKLDKEDRKLRIVATSEEVDEEYKKLELSLTAPGINHHLSTHKVFYLGDVREDSPYYIHSDHAASRGWVSILSAPMRVENSLIGMIDVYTKTARHFKDWEKGVFGAFAGQVAVNLQQAVLVKENEKHRHSKDRLDDLIKIMREMSETRSVDSLLQLILKESLELVGAEKGAVCKLDARCEKLEIVAVTGENPKPNSLKRGEGIVWKSLQNEQPERVDNVIDNKCYVEWWKETRSELAIPIVIRNADIRIGRDTKRASKPVGVLNIESPRVNAFTQEDQDVLFTLASHAAILIERLEFERKLDDLHKIETKIFGERNYDKVIDAVLRGITKTLGFEMVNISLVTPESNTIRTEHVTGIPRYEVDKFKSMAIHSLSSNDIQADIIRNKEIEVPDANDQRFDEDIFKRFRHDRLIRVFVPMIASTDKPPIGIVEAGYLREHRKYIYEQDVQILKGFVEYAVQAIEQKKSGQVDKIRHEFKAPVVSIRNNADTLRRRYSSMRSDVLENRFDDILVDCEILIQQVGELDYILGKPSPPASKIERLVFHRDVVIKTINQLIKPFVKGNGYSLAKIKYDATDSTRIIIYSDRTKLNQVVYNVLTNSIKYAKRDKETFRIQVEVEEGRRNITIKFQDWGIGIAPGFEDKIFEEGFRTTEAIGRNVSGSGLGLTIARQIMRGLGGDLVLFHNSEPTEFHMIIPKSLTQAPDGE